MVKCDKCQKGLTAKSLKYNHKCGQDNNNTKKPSPKIIEYKHETPEETQGIVQLKKHLLNQLFQIMNRTLEFK